LARTLKSANKRLLQGIGSIVWITGGPKCHRPEAVTVPLNDLGEGVRITGYVTGHQLGVARRPEFLHGGTA
jgi:hypothetical protein